MSWRVGFNRIHTTDALRARLHGRGAWGNIKPMPNRVNVPAFCPRLYRYRKLVGRLFNHLALAKLAAARIWMRSMSR